MTKYRFLALLFSLVGAEDINLSSVRVSKSSKFLNLLKDTYNGSDKPKIQHSANEETPDETKVIGDLEKDDLSSDSIKITNSSEDCLAVVVESISAEGSTHGDPEWYCENKHKLLYKIEGLDSRILNEDKLISGVSHIVSHNATKKVDLNSEEDDTIILNKNSIEVQKKEDGIDERDLTYATGTRTLLILRVRSLDGQPSASAAKLSDKIFGSSPNTFASHVSGCSKGKLKFKPASGKKITGGVAEIFVPAKFKNMNSNTASNLVKKEAKKQLGFELPGGFHHVMGVVQGDLKAGGGKWGGAWAELGRWFSFFSDRASMSTYVIFHELAHNLGIHHSNEDGREYGDGTGYMGGGWNDNKCFNGSGSWFLKWYSDRQISINPKKEELWTGSLVGVNDYTHGRVRGTDKVVIKVETSENYGDLYIMMNHKKGINSQTDEYGDLVTIVRAKNDARTSHKSHLLAALGKGQSISVGDIIIRVCDITKGKFAKPRGSSATIMVYHKRNENKKSVNLACGICDCDRYPVVPICMCMDKNDFCAGWARHGECKKNPRYMIPNCKKSCGTCSMLGSCSDKISSCSSWASRGECYVNPKYMIPNCKKSCKSCSGCVMSYVPLHVKPCKDHHHMCGSWAKRGECKKNPKYMHHGCKKSCGKCH